eukprot:scaffold436_cov267-Pinguiococcus_pyrenoidosus.AAC.18
MSPFGANTHHVEDGASQISAHFRRGLPSVVVSHPIRRQRPPRPGSVALGSVRSLLMGWPLHALASPGTGCEEAIAPGRVHVPVGSPEGVKIGRIFAVLEDPVGLGPHMLAIPLPMLLLLVLDAAVDGLDIIRLLRILVQIFQGVPSVGPPSICVGNAGRRAVRE